MQRSLIAMLAIAAVAGLSSISALAQGSGRTRGGDAMRADPPRLSTTGSTSRSLNSRTRGANSRTFCPPGQAKKQGRGSAFNC
jgi:hypothetical protein